MLTTTTTSRGRGRVAIVGLALVALTTGTLAAAMPTAADTGAATRILGHRPPRPVVPTVPDVGRSTNHTAGFITGRAGRAGAQVATVKVTNALLRSQPNTSSTKLDVSQPGRQVDIYCWHDYTDTSRYVWFKAHPHGSKYTGWMRADLLTRSGPLPSRC